MIGRHKLVRVAFYAALLSLSSALTLGAQPTWTSGTYVYDGNGNISAIGTDTFAYDAASRLLSGTAGAGHNQTYRYDAFGNLTQIVTDGQASTLVLGVDPSTNRITVPLGQTAASGLVVTATGQYDGAGNMTGYQNGLYTFAYDGLNMLKDYQGGGRHEIYIYTPANERIAVATVSGSGTSATVNSTRWTIRGLDNKVLREFDDANPSGGHLWSWKEDWIYANGQVIAAENDQPDHTLHFFSDHLGTPRLVTGSGGAIARHTYYPFGEEATSPAQDAEVMKFTGHERDSLLDYMHARFTDAALGRFLSVDPSLDLKRASREPQGWNRYAYVVNSPLRHTDPTGRCNNSVVCLNYGKEEDKTDVTATPPPKEAPTIQIVALQNLTASAESTGVSINTAQVTGAAIDQTLTPGPEFAYHYTFAENVPGIVSQGLRPGSFATPSALTPIQAQIELALPPNRGLPDTTLRINLSRMSEENLNIPWPMRVTGMVSGPGGRMYNVPGGGEEMEFPEGVPPEFIEIIPPS